MYYILTEWNKVGRTDRAWSGPYLDKEVALMQMERKNEGDEVSGWHRTAVLVKTVEDEEND